MSHSMNQIAVVTNEGYLLLYRFEFPRLVPIVRSKVSDSALYLPIYNKFKNLVITDRKTIQIYQDLKLTYELPVEQARHLSSIAGYLVVSTSDGTYVYDEQHVFTRYLQSNLSIPYQKAAILADSKFFHFYYLGGDVTGKFNYSKHLNDFLIGFAVEGTAVVCCGQRKLVVVDLEKDAVTFYQQFEDLKITSFLRHEQLLLLGSETGVLLYFEHSGVAPKLLHKYQLAASRVKQLCVFGQVYAYCCTEGEFGLIYFDDDGSLCRLCCERTSLRINGIACCGGVAVVDEEPYGEEEQQAEDEEEYSSKSKAQ